jgi:hypothetical protein
LSEVVITRKIEIAVLADKDKKNNDWFYLRNLSKEVFRAANILISHNYFNDTFKSKMLKSDEELSKEKISTQTDIDALKAKMEETDEDKLKDKITKQIEKEKKHLNSLTYEEIGRAHV